MDALLDDDPEPAPWDGRRVPVTLLGGYLGAGKTTVVNELLVRTERPIAVLVNDVGSVAVDAALIRRRHGDTIELTDGCICCSLRAGLAAAFDGLRARPAPPDHLVIELSGVADPRQVVAWANSPGFRLDGIVVLVDVDAATTLADDPVVGGAYRRQIEAADLVLLTKLDLVDDAAAARVRALVQRLAPGVAVLEAAHAAGSAGLLSIATRRPAGFDATPDPSLFDVHDVTLATLPRPIGQDALRAMLDDLGADVLRAKGIAEHPDGTKSLIQVVGRRRVVTPLPDAEDQPATDLVVITARR
jgi:G3E family GTPase